MKTFSTDKPLVRYALPTLGIFTSSLLGTTSALLLIGVIFK